MNNNQIMDRRIPDNKNNQNNQSNQKEQEKIILFIHKDSNPCKKIIEVIKNHSKKFNLEIGEISQMQTIPSQIKNLPALVIENGTKLIEGKEVFNYFQNQELVFIDLNSSSKNFGSSIGSSFGDYNNLDNNTNNLFSSLNEDDMSKGIPEYKEEDNKTIDLEKIQKERSGAL